MGQQPAGFVPDGFLPDAAPTAHLSAAYPGTAFGTDMSVIGSAAADAAKAGVTPIDVRDDPIGAMARIGSELKRDATDPKTWLTLAALYFGPKVFNAAAPIVARAANRVGQYVADGPIPAIRNMDPDLVSMVSPRAGAKLRYAQKVAAKAPATSPVETPPAAAPPATAAATAAPAAPVAVGKALAALKAHGGLTDSEVSQTVTWLKAGVDPETVWQRIQDARALQMKGAFAKLPTNAEVDASVAHRNATGKWTD